MFEDDNHLGEKVFFVENKSLKGVKLESNSDIAFKHYVDLVNLCHEEHHKLEMDYIKKITKSSYDMVWECFFQQSKKQNYRFWDDNPESNYEPEINFRIENEIHKYFYDAERDVEILWEEPAVEKKVSDLITKRKYLHKIFIEWLEINKEFLTYMGRHNLEIMLKGRNRVPLLGHDYQDSIEGVDQIVEFALVERIILIQNTLTPGKNIENVKSNIKRSDWFQDGVRLGVFDKYDAIFPIPIKGIFKTKLKSLRVLELLPQGYQSKVQKQEVEKQKQEVSQGKTEAYWLNNSSNKSLIKPNWLANYNKKNKNLPSTNLE